MPHQGEDRMDRSIMEAKSEHHGSIPPNEECHRRSQTDEAERQTNPKAEVHDRLNDKASVEIRRTQPPIPKVVLRDRRARSIWLFRPKRPRNHVRKSSHKCRTVMQVQNA